MRLGIAAVAASLVVLLALVACGAGVSEFAESARRLPGEAQNRGVSIGDRAREPAPVLSSASPDVQSVVAALDGLDVASRGSGIDYRRSDWRHWVDADRDCQNTRAEALIEESSVPVSFATGERCRVTAGEWLGPWSGQVFADASDVDIDHHVPLAHAHDAGGWAWDKARKREYANDLSNPNALQVTSASVNRAKGKQAPDQWRPDVRASWCRYAADWVSVKSQWELTVTVAELEALKRMLATCAEPDSWGLSGVPE